MRIVVAGLGIQGRKRRHIAGDECVATVDPNNGDAMYRRIEDVPLANYDGALLCVPDEAKPDLVTYLLENGKHILVEKPFVASGERLREIKSLCARGNAVFYTAYNHRFEPNLVKLRDDIASGRMGEIYLARFFYGNGTARDVRNSPWRDRGAGVLPDLGSHLIDMALFLFGDSRDEFDIWSANCFENKAYDHVAIGRRGRPVIEMEMTLLSWRNHFTADVFGERGSAHISSLCKWGPTTFTARGRVLPSGRPDESAITLTQADPTWEAEYRHWKTMCTSGGPSTIDNDIYIAAALARLATRAAATSP